MSTCSIDGIESLLREAGLSTPIPTYPGASIVNNPQDIFRAYLSDLLLGLVDCDRSVACEAIQASNVTGMGDLVVVTPRLRIRDVNPKDLVTDLAKKLPNSPPFSCPIADGIHLRVLSSPKTLPRLLVPFIGDRKESYGYDVSIGKTDAALQGRERKKVVVEFSSPNMAGHFQVSHLRSALLGVYVSNLHQAFGWDVVRINYIGDWGKQIGLFAAGWKRFGKEEELSTNPMRHMLDINDQIEKLFKPEQEACKAAKLEGKDTADIETSGLYAERDDVFKKLEERDVDAIALWRKFRDITVDCYIRSYRRLGVRFDEYSGESLVSQSSIAVVEATLKEKGILEYSEDSWIIDFSKHGAKGLSTAILRYRNGTTSYLLRDVAAVLDRWQTHSFDKMIYIVAMEQEMHFNRVTKVLRLMDRTDLAEKLQHIPFAKITKLVDEMQNVQSLDDQVDGIQKLLHEALLCPDENEILHVTTSDESCRKIAAATLLVQDFSHKRTTSYTSDAKQMTDANADTGLAFQNCYARLSAELGDFSTIIEYRNIQYSLLETEDYTELLRIIAQYPDTALASYKALEPSLIVGYVSRLVEQIVVTLDDDDEAKETQRNGSSADFNAARLALLDCAKRVLGNALEVLGVQLV